jgi:uncharacterized protein
MTVSLRQPARQLQVQAVGHLAPEEAEEWDKIAAGAGLYGSYAWLSTVAKQDTCIYITVRDRRSGAMLCVLPVYVLRDLRDRGSYDPRILLGGFLAEQERESSFPMILVGSRSGYYNALPVERARGESLGREALRSALHAVTEIAGTESAGSIVLPYLTGTALRRARQCYSHWPLPPILSAGYASLNIDFSSTAEYLQRFPSGRRRNIARELEWMRDLPSRDGLSSEPLSRCLHEVAPLVANVQGRHGHADTVAEILGRLRSLVSVWGDDAVVFSYRQSGVLVAAATALLHAEELYMRAAALDYDRIVGTPAYFAVSYYQPLATALQENMRRIHWGTAAYRPKVLRGALIEPLWTLYRARGAGGIAVDVLRSVSQRNADLLLAETGSVCGADSIASLLVEG